MTDSSVPLPRQRRVPRRRPLDGPESLTGRLLIQVAARRVGQVRGRLDPALSGLVISGPDALRKTAALRDEGHEGVVLADPARYGDGVATADEPFLSPADQLPAADPLGQAVEDQLGAGATAVLTPTGYLPATDTPALIAAVRQLTARQDPRIVLVLPIDVGWLRPERVDRLIDVLGTAPGAKAVMLGGRKDPLASFPEAVTGLARVVSDVPDVALLRADLAAFGALARGASFAAYGESSRMRHVVPPGEAAGRPGFSDSPSVLLPELMGLFLGTTIARRFAATRPPVCECAACGGRPLDSFTTRLDGVPASRHNTAVLMSWLRSLRALPPGPDRQRWWQQKCRAAVDLYPVVNAEIRQPQGFPVPPQLHRWSVLEAVPSAPAGTASD
ncbi:hypothetical protein [Streptomyces sp. NRRL B-24484]|uniref:hypothetical protein n=1 Tax=Streptomyces sp. NRRL B-24484 TaxID=1463833 RepID=UPI0006943C8C|nr:hypothetical protein [Streptomyces sp. NRRL B-24484]